MEGCAQEGRTEHSSKESGRGKNEPGEAPEQRTELENPPSGNSFSSMRTREEAVR